MELSTAVSPDGKFWWDGRAWQPMPPLSPDGKFWWDGRAWQPTRQAAVQPVAQPAPDPAPRASWTFEGAGPYGTSGEQFVVQPPTEYRPPAGPAVPTWQAQADQDIQPAAGSRFVSPVMAVVVAVVIVVAGMAGYLVGGTALASSRLASANSALTTVMSHQEAMQKSVDTLSIDFVGSGSSSGPPPNISQQQDLLKRVLGQANGVLTGINNDDSSLAAADSSLLEYQWLTWRSRSSLNATSAKIEAERNVLSEGIALTADYVSLGDFYQALYAASADMQTIGAAAQTSDINSATSADAMLKADVQKAISLDTAPGLPSEVDGVLQALEKLASDFGSLLYYASLGDSSATLADQNAVRADVAKVQSYDLKAIDAATAKYYRPLVVAFDSDVAKLGTPGGTKPPAV